MDGDGNARERGSLDEFESSQCFELWTLPIVQWRCVWVRAKETDCIGLEDTGVCAVCVCVCYPMHCWAAELQLCLSMGTNRVRELGAHTP